MDETNGVVAEPEATNGHACGRHAFVHERVLELIVQETVVSGSLAMRKRELAQKLGCCDRMVDRALTKLRRAGQIVSTPSFDASGAQLGNTYRATQAGITRAEELLRERAAGRIVTR
ncbi:hypothetical protein [Collinsella sp. An2]|uniref:hypothetical protein n=1 Tax=Collinsella sp. An2 TaxID=1965585 RepID=UPI000B36C876|nr:hypothetical protein [Collinsella sp. An2]OUP09188.1 hypothetical protein B5F33_05505 [Collinsella sp. An2]